MRRLVVFDFDGTLADTGSGITRSAQYALDQMGWPHYETDQLGFFVGPPLNDSFMRLGMKEEEALRAVALFRDRYASSRKSESSRTVSKIRSAPASFSSLRSPYP